MNYPAYNPYSYPAFGPQGRSAGFSGGYGYPVPPMPPQNAPAPVSAPNTAGFVVQPVSSLEEARAVIADPFSAGVLMPDLSHGVIYLKRVNPQTGASDFGEFHAGVAEPAAVEFVPVSVFNSTVEKLREEIAASKRGKAVRRDDSTDE